MNDAVFWFLFSGLLFSTIGVLHFSLSKSPITSSMVYLFCGVLVGPGVLRFVEFYPVEHLKLIEHLTEVVVIISVFACGLKAKPRVGDRRWVPPLKLASIGMLLCIAGVSAVGYALGLPLGAAILLGAVLAPTDPVLASAVQVDHEEDGDSLRFALTAEAGLNDGSAFPFLYLGLGLMGHHYIGQYGEQWLLADVLYKTAMAAVVGFLFAKAAAYVVTKTKTRSQESFVLDEFFGLGLLMLSYGACLLLDAYGFVAAFICGMIFRIAEREKLGDDKENLSGSDMVSFNENIEKVGEFVAIVFVGSLLRTSYFVWQNILVAVLLLFVIRPLSVLLSFTRLKPIRRNLAAWFGVRGVGSLYYLSFAIGLIGFTNEMESIYEIVLITIAISVVLHGVTSNWLMQMYKAREGRTVDEKEKARSLSEARS